MRISVIGGSTVTDEQYAMGREVGRLLAARGHEVVCGGRTGVMEAVCRGAREEGGHTIGILPGDDRGSANPHVETAIATGMGNARNALVALNGDAAIAIDGGTGNPLGDCARAGLRPACRRTRHATHRGHRWHRVRRHA
jgi:uncharacterized protein (TIGR00725 family)